MPLQRGLAPDAKEYARLMGLIEELNERVDELDDWSQQFLESVETQLKTRKTLTSKQVAKLEQIHTELTDGPGDWDDEEASYGHDPYGRPF